MPVSSSRTGNAHAAAMAVSRQLRGVQAATSAQLCAQERDRMAAKRGAGTAVVGLHVFPGAGQRQRHAGLGGGAGVIEQRQPVFHAGDIPARTMAMAAEPTQRASIGEQALLATVQRGALAQVAHVVEGAPRTFSHDGLHGSPSRCGARPPAARGCHAGARPAAAGRGCRSPVAGC
ncbi:hypothetical protein G6F24_015376 [Rhizopus arrhizus]|nr:hypothetical protein G6F24_015376 [Rhizopus arrhizus]